MLKNIIHLFVLSCRKATYLMEKRMNSRLSVIEKWQLWLHLRICKGCSCYEKEAEIIDKAMRRLSDDGESRSHNAFSDEELVEAKKKIKNRVHTS